MTELEEDIIVLIAHDTGKKKKLCQLSSRLAQDIGMDGDEAVEFFEKFREKFYVDLTLLGNRWDDHFGSESISDRVLDSWW